MVLKIIRFYQIFLNPIVSGISSSSCRFSPTCSEYTYQAVEKYGTIRGLFWGARRILKCHPFSKEGIDPVR